MSYFIIIRGPAGVGKSTIAKRISKKLNAYYISFDKIMKKNKLDLLKGDGISTENFIKANNLVIPEAINRLKKGQIVVFDGCFYRKMQLTHLKKHLKFKHFVFTLTAPLNDCLIRNNLRKKPISEQAVKAVYFLVNKLNAGSKINTSEKSIDESVDELLAGL